jgi:hypothetical protein
MSPGELAGDDLFESLESIWNECPPAVRSPRGQQGWQRLMAWAKAARARGAQLTLGVPPSDPKQNGESPMRLLPERLAFWPRGIPSRPWTAIVTSRLARRLDQWGGWFDYFHSAAAVIQARRAVLLTAEGTAGERFARSAAQRLSLHRLAIRAPRPGEQLHNWLARLLAEFSADECPAPAEIWLSPAIVTGGIHRPSAEEPVPLRDEALVALADELYAVHVRRGGNVERLIRACLLACPAQRARVHLPVQPQLVAPELARELIDLGAEAWHAAESPRTAATSRLAPPASVHPSRDAEILTSLPSGPWSFLSHTTRAIHGPWPDQSEDEYAAELLATRGGDARTARATLLRIVSQRRMIASGRGIRRGARVVCFTEIPLAELSGFRTYRPHRGRWDFEPYGICIRRKWLEPRGARPVIYGDERTWQALDASLRPFFQRRSSGPDNQPTYDWSIEREWRHVGDVPLDCLPADAAMLFVPDRGDADALARVSPWPIVVLGT